MQQHLTTALEAALKAGIEILKVYSQTEITVRSKADESPLTEADKQANEVINTYLKPTGIPIISEENKLTEFDVRKGWTSCWIVDPLDGTKEFIKRNGEFTVNIALIEHGIPVLGVIYVPVTREMYFAIVNENKAYKAILSNEAMNGMEIIDIAEQIQPASVNQKQCRVVGSRSHMNEDTITFVEDLKKKFEAVTIVSKGSSLKFCLVAEGKADVYPRYAPTMEWDTAAGQAICQAVGLEVISRATGKTLLYNKENLLNAHFLVK